jgi:hypothetical protein
MSGQRGNQFGEEDMHKHLNLVRFLIGEAIPLRRETL